MAAQELDRLFSTVIESQITLALTLLNSGRTSDSAVEDTEAKRIAALACSAAERFASRLPAAETRLYWNRRVIDIRLALADVRQ